MPRKILTVLICTMLIFRVCSLTTKAESSDMFYDLFTEEEKASFVEKMDLKIIQNDDFKIGIQCFDVSQNGIVALGLGAGSNCRIFVYDSYGKFQYGYRFCSDGDYGIQFQGDILSIYFLRGNIIAYFDSTGVCVDIQKISDFNHVYIKEILNRNVKELAGKRYVLERDFDIGEFYSRMVIIDEFGERTTVYDVTTSQIVGQIAGASLIAFFLLTVFLGCIRKRRRQWEYKD